MPESLLPSWLLATLVAVAVVKPVRAAERAGNVDQDVCGPRDLALTCRSDQQKNFRMAVISARTPDMSNVPKLETLSVDDYLAGEVLSDVKYDYVDGRVYAMAGGTNVHNRIASRVLIQLGRQLDGSPCEALNSDTKIRVRRQSRNYFYYPDALVVCQSNPDGDTFQDRPVVIVEVIS